MTSMSKKLNQYAIFYWNLLLLIQKRIIQLNSLTSISDGLLLRIQKSHPMIVGYILEVDINLVVGKEGYETKSVAVTLTENDPPMLTIMLDPIEELIVDKIELNNIYFDFDNLTLQVKLHLSR